MSDPQTSDPSSPASDHHLDFTDHRRELDDNRVVYAVVSRRARGLSIGLNLNPDKVCNFACPYCQVDRTTPGMGEGKGKGVSVDEVDRELDRLLQLVSTGRLWSVPPFDSAATEHRVVRDIALAGDGEPTTARAFDEIIERVGEVRARHGLQDKVALSLLTNATMFQRPAVQRGLDIFDSLGGSIWAKLDAGTQGYFSLVDGTELPLQRVLDNILWAAQRYGVVLQCMFMTIADADGNHLGPSDAELDAWAGRLRWIVDQGGRIDLVQVYSLARRPADARVGVLPQARLEDIGARSRALGLDTVVVPGVG